MNGLEGNSRSRDAAELEDSIGHIWSIARESGLDPYPTHFDLVPPNIMYELGAYGMPSRFSHWTHGRDYFKMKTDYDHGRSRLYELVVNTNPAQAYLLDSNPVIANKMVIAHVFGHVDFFRHNPAFRSTDRKMHNSTAAHADLLRQHEMRYGREVETYLDAALSIEWNIDSSQSALHKSVPADYLRENQQAYEEELNRKPASTAYDDLFALTDTQGPQEVKPTNAPLPFKPEPDLLWFIANFAPKQLEEWQKDVLEIVRTENYYFYPQMKTKVMNEGWASYWHVKIMREMGERGLLNDAELIEWAKLTAGVVSPQLHPLTQRTLSLNPYYLGYKIWEDINRRYHGELSLDDTRDYSALTGERLDPLRHKNADEYDIFTVREMVPSDEAFVRNYLSDTLIEELQLFKFGRNSKGEWVIESRNPQVVREHLARHYGNHFPVIQVASGGGDYNNNRELYLEHVWDGQELDITWANKTLQAIQFLWGKPVRLSTVENDKPVLISCYGPAKFDKAAI